MEGLKKRKRRAGRLNRKTALGGGLLFILINVKLNRESTGTLGLGMATLPEVISNGELPVLDDWEPLSRKRILRYFDRSLEYADVSAYVSAQGELLPDERIILVFLNAVYTQSLATVELYCRYVVELLNYARKPSFSVTARDIESYIRQCRMKGLKPRSVNTIIGALKSYFKRLADTGAIALNPTAFIKKRKDGAGISLPGNLTHSLSESEMLLLFDRLAEHGAPQRDILLLKTLFMTGLRGEEAVSLCWKDVTVWQGQRYFNVLGKGSKERRIYLPDEIDEGLNEYGKLTGTSPNQPIFGNLRKPSRRIGRHALYHMVKKWLTTLMNRPDVSPHWFRHSCFTYLASKGVRLESIQALAGHASIDTTMLYNEAAQLMVPAGTAFNKSHSYKPIKRIE